MINLETVMSRSSEGLTPYAVASAHGHLAAMREFEAFDASVAAQLASDKSDHGVTPLMLAAVGGHVHVVQHLLSMPSVGVGAADERQRTALHYAAQCPHPDSAT